ncbi:heavy metal sensor histidine kinase [Pseudoalteromonas lipolytica]|uniref:heavy metal sensor histidine kinase n=1 Tax=Pseudoalteromonas lipolytica TaxID=570156 RepID=UPI003A9841B7
MRVSTRPLSLTMRVLLFVAITIIGCFTFVASLINSSIEHHFLQQDSGELQVITQSVESVLSQPFQSQKQLENALSIAVVGHHGVYYQVNTLGGELVYQSSHNDFTELAMRAKASQGFKKENIITWHTGSKAYRALVSELETSKQHYKIAVAIDMSFHLRFLTQFKQSLWVIMLGSAVLVLLVAWIAIHQGLNPLRGLTQKMLDIQTNKMDVRLDHNNVPVELENMVQSFNVMLDRLQSEFIRLSNFSSDIAHELRTPLTNIITQTQVGLSKSRAVVDYQELLFSNLEELERLTKMVNDMLWLAKTQNGLIKPKQQILHSHDEIASLFDYFDALAEEAGICFKTEGENLRFYCDQLHFRQLLSNLLSNAIRYTPKGASISVKSEIVSADTVCISVVNPGEKIPAEHLPYLFDRFYRPDKSRQKHSDGVGLGLAIVKALAEANDGAIKVYSDEHETCFSVCLKLAKLT